MAGRHEKLAEALSALKKLQDKGQRVMRSSSLKREYRERLLAAGFLTPIVKKAGTCPAGWMRRLAIPRPGMPR